MRRIVTLSVRLSDEVDNQVIREGFCPAWSPPSSIGGWDLGHDDLLGFTM